MIKRILIENFQSIEKLDLTLDQITVFRGENRQGKSAILRAIRAVTLNPRGSRDIRSRAHSCSVFIETEKGSVAYEKERQGSASYAVQLPGMEPILKQKVTEVPREVFEVLNIGDVAIDDDLSVNLNYSSQLEPHFLLPPLWGTTTGVAKVIGKITNVDKLSAASRACATDLRTAKMELSGLQEKIRELEQMSPSYASVDTEVQLAEQLVALQQSVDELDRAIQMNGLEQYEHITKDLSLVGFKLAVLESVPFSSLDQLTPDMDAFSVLHNTLSQVVSISEDLINCKSDIDASGQRLQLAESAMQSFMERTKFCPVCSKPWTEDTVHT